MVLVTGANGQLGRSLQDRGNGFDCTVITTDLDELDITNELAVREFIREHPADVIINAAAYTAVDKAETETELATRVNVLGPRNIAIASRDVGARLIHISTDFVFEGTATTPYKPDAATSPLSVYGRTKRDGELAVLEEAPDSAVVIRTSWLYSKTGGNFVKTMLKLMGERDELSVVADQVGSPTWANSLADAVWAFAAAPEHSGIFHWADAGETNWHGFAVAIQEEAVSLGLLNRPIEIHAIKTEDYPTAAIRPRFSVLDCSTSIEAIKMQPTAWRSNLRKMLKGLME
jgi:dTDP-4-dehydrorhamnose reductase